MTRKPNLNIEKLRESQLTKDELFKENPELINLEIEKKRKQREEAKLAIIRKINADANQVQSSQAQPAQSQVTQIKKTADEPLKRTSITPSQNEVKAIQKEQAIPAPNIRIIKDNNLEVQQEKLKETQERLSYTLQMDIISKDQQSAYRKRKQRKAGLDVNDKFKKLTPRITKIYVFVVVLLLFLITIAFYFYTNVTLN